MNCQDFEAVVNDIARAQMIDVSVRDEALGHSGQCARCAQRLEDELAITLRLSSFAASFESVGAPARVEARLLAAFEERALVKSQPLVGSRARYWIAAIAAVIVIMFTALSIVRWRQVAPPNQAANQLLVAAAGALTSFPRAAVSVASYGDESQPAIQRRRPATTRHNREAGSLTTFPSTSMSTTSSNNEIATDFLPVTYGGAANLSEGGRIMRVELPRSAMATFGLPVNMDRANDRVKADVLVGVDGLAHAIRFVR